MLKGVLQGQRVPFRILGTAVAAPIPPSGPQQRPGHSQDFFPCRTKQAVLCSPPLLWAHAVVPTVVCSFLCGFETFPLQQQSRVPLVFLSPVSSHFLDFITMYPELFPALFSFTPLLLALQTIGRIGASSLRSWGGKLSSMLP